MRQLARKLWGLARPPSTLVGCAWQEGWMLGVQLEVLGRSAAAAYHVKAMHASAHAWGGEQLAQGLTTGLPWGSFRLGLNLKRAQVALACPHAWVAYGQYEAQASAKRQTVLAESRCWRPRRQERITASCALMHTRQRMSLGAGGRHPTVGSDRSNSI
jgi:hypothetical protein